MASSVLLGYREKKGSGDESINMLDGKFTVTRIFEGPYLDRIKFTKTFLNRTVRGSLFGANIRLPFQEHPKHKGLYATSAEIKGVLGADKTIIGDSDIFKYKLAIVTIKYQALPFAQPNRGEGASNDQEEKPLFDFIEETSDASLEILQIPGEDIVEGGENQFDQGPQNHVQVLIHVNIRQPFVAKPHWAQMLANAGKINRGLFFTPAGKIFPALTVRYDGWSDSIKIDAISPQSFLWDISHKFVYNRIGWHNKWIKGGFKELDNKIYEEGNLMEIFFGQNGGGPAADLISEIQLKENQIIVKNTEIQNEIAGNNDAEVVRQLNVERLGLENQRNQLIADAGGTLLTIQPDLQD